MAKPSKGDYVVRNPNAQGTVTTGCRHCHWTRVADEPKVSDVFAHLESEHGIDPLASML